MKDAAFAILGEAVAADAENDDAKPPALPPVVSERKDLDLVLITRGILD